MKRSEQDLIDSIEERLLDRLMGRLAKKQRQDQGNQRTGSQDLERGGEDELLNFVFLFFCFCVASPSLLLCSFPAGDGERRRCVTIMSTPQRYFGQIGRY